ncbi:MAG TPA: AAA family ATPase [Actinomycetota bacterium]|nr:AAA family ATPase [Actinomycetota bacterium]
MFLRSLQLRGFKSFADKTTLEFAPGLSVIVGPNGSGKSNLVDAISWVLGEQGPRALRGAHMADVIFAGSPGRSGLGMAQVSLVIDNSEGLIPVDLSEIEIARVVYRSGESQYLLGGEPVRLMDIQEMLSDTGIGRGLHTVVGQGQLEDVLTARPEDRRQFIEEAAGIAKHRRRKDRAQRKLAGIEQDLVRLQDVMAELKRQLRPLKQQAEAATKHEELSALAAELAWRLAASRLRALYEERDGRRPGWERGMALRKEADERLAALDAEIASIAGRLVEAEAALEAAERRHAEAAGTRTRAESRLREAVRDEGDARARLAAESGRQGRLFTLEEELRRIEADLAATISALADREAGLAEAERRFAAAERARRESEDAASRAREDAVTRRAEAATLRRMLESAGEERERLRAALDEVVARQRGLADEREALEREIERLDAEETPLADRQAELTKQAERIRTVVGGAEDRERALEGRRQVLEARRKALAETPGRRLLARRAGRAAGLLGELLHVEPGLEKAVAAALGPLADAVVYADHGAAVADASDAAGAALAVSEDAPGGFLLEGERTLLSVVHPDPAASEAARALLRHVYLASDAAEALAKHRRHPGASFVTPDGVLVGPALVRTAPTPSEDELAVRREWVVVERDLNRARKDLGAARGSLDAVRAEAAEVAEALRRIDALITAAAERMAALDAGLAATARERDILEQRVAVVEETVASATAAMQRMPQERDDVPDVPPAPEPPLALRVEVEALRRERRRLAQALAQRRADAEHVRSIDPQQLAAEAERTAGHRERAEAELERAQAALAAAVDAREDASRHAAELRSAEAEANRAWREAAGDLQRLRDRYEDEEQARRDLLRRIDEAERVLREGHGRDPAQAVAELAEDDTLESLQRRSDLVARRLALLGRVNLVAADEYRALQERHDFLQREIDDVKAARRDLRTVVQEVDRKIREIFDAAFRDVAGEFASLFATLFPEGEGKLTLTDPDDLLATGIEIEARPGRKRVKRLSLLSGGERALTALAFLFAIFRARPSPFYLLDEVEAALDDINLHRFIGLVRGFAETSQVLLVTHQKRTMEAAEVLYGVSMGKDGASSVISQRISEAVPGR